MTETPNNTAKNGTADGEVVVPLTDGWSLRSGVYGCGAVGTARSGEYVRLCRPDGSEYGYWDQEEWAADPALVMGAIINAAAGARLDDDTADPHDDVRAADLTEYLFPGGEPLDMNSSPFVDAYATDTDRYDGGADGCDNCGGDDHACDTCPEFTSVSQYDAHVLEDHVERVVPSPSALMTALLAPQVSLSAYERAALLGTPNDPNRAGPETLGVTLFALSISHAHGTDVTVHRTREGAHERLFGFVSDWWISEVGDNVPMPPDPEKAISMYFEAVEDEDYLLETTTVFD